MSLEEKELIVENPCERCRGFGYTKVVMYQERKYFIICDRCYGRKNIDWISAAVGINFDDPLKIIWHLIDNLFPGNFIMSAPDRYYLIRREFWYEQDFKKRYKYIIMTVEDPLTSGDTEQINHERM